MFNTVVPFRITEETGRLIAEWLNVGSPMKPSRKEEKSKSEEEEEATYEEPKDLPEDQEEPGADLF